MAPERLLPKVSFILHIPKEMPYSKRKLLDMISCIHNQRDIQPELILLDQAQNQDIIDEINTNNDGVVPLVVIKEQFSTLGAWLNAARARAKSDFLLYIDNQAAEIYLQSSAASLFLLTAERNPQAGLIYADYGIKKGRKTNEVHLLKPHEGRLRDNQDYGLVLFLRQSSLSECGGFDESLKFNTLYDIRLKLKESAKQVHISNRYAGYLYRVVAPNKGHNVFDYLIASKESQQESRKCDHRPS